MKLTRLSRSFAAFSAAVSLSFVLTGCEEPKPATSPIPAPAGAAEKSDPLSKIKIDEKPAPKETPKVETKEAPKVETKEVPKVEAKAAPALTAPVDAAKPK